MQIKDPQPRLINESNITSCIKTQVRGLIWYRCDVTNTVGTRMRVPLRLWWRRSSGVVKFSFIRLEILVVRVWLVLYSGQFGYSVEEGWNSPGQRYRVTYAIRTTCRRNSVFRERCSVFVVRRKSRTPGNGKGRINKSNSSHFIASVCFHVRSLTWRTRYLKTEIFPRFSVTTKRASVGPLFRCEIKFTRWSMSVRYFGNLLKYSTRLSVFSQAKGDGD